MAEMPLWAKTSFQCSQECSGRESLCPSPWELSVWARKSLPRGRGRAGVPRWSRDHGTRDHDTVASIPAWKWLQPLTAAACLCLSDEDFQARRQQLREEEETPKEGQ